MAAIILPAAACAQSLKAEQPQQPYNEPVAQTIKFGYFSYDKVLKSMGDYIIAEHNIKQLRAQYADEAKRSEDDFNSKYEAFLDEQGNLATSIRNKRQAELLELMQKNMTFKTEAEKLIKDAETNALDSVCRKLDAVIAEVGTERKLAFIVNTDNHNLPFVNPVFGEDITSAIEEKLKNN